MEGREPDVTRMALFLLIGLLLAACTPARPSALRPTESRPLASSEDLVPDAELLDSIHRRFESGSYGYVDRFLLMRNGHVLADHSYEQDYEMINRGRDATPHPYNYYDTDWHPYYLDTDLHTLQSVTKGITSILIGIAIGRGEVPGAHVRVLDYFGGYEIKQVDERKQRMALEDVLTMRAGLEWDEWTYPIGDERNSVTQLEMSEDWIQFVLDLPMACEPGEVFVYNSGASQLLSVIVKEATGLHIDEYAEEHLFKPLGIDEYYWKKTPNGWPDSEGGLYLRAEDLAKVGRLVLQQGVWDGQQITPGEWIAEMTRPKAADVAPDDPGWNAGYGYQWWLLGDQARGMEHVYGGLGYGGQFLFVVPERDLVAVFYAWNIYGTRSSIVMDLFLEQILPGIESGQTLEAPCCGTWRGTSLAQGSAAAGVAGYDSRRTAAELRVTNPIPPVPMVSAGGLS